MAEGDLDPMEVVCERCGTSANYFVMEKFHGIPAAEGPRQTLCMACFQAAKRELGLGNGNEMNFTIGDDS